MDSLRELCSRLAGLFRRRNLEAEMAEEMRQHLEHRAQERIADGLSPEEARYTAQRQFGGLTQTQEHCRDERRFVWVEQVLQDVRHAVRSLRKSPGFSAVAVLSLGLGIGANTAVFSLVNAVLLGSLPVPNPQELRTIQWSGMDLYRLDITGRISGPNGSGSGTITISSSPGERISADAFTYPLYRHLREQGAALADIFAFAELDEINTRARREPFVAGGLMVSDTFFSALGVRPAIGRLFAAGDDQPGAAPLAIITYSSWEKHFDLDPGVLGLTASLNGNAFTIVGVLPREFRGLDLAGLRDFYVPMSAQPLLMPNHPVTASDRWWVHLMARVRPGAGAASLQTTLEIAFASQLEKAMTAPRIEIGAGRAGPAYDQREYRKSLLLLLSVVGIVIFVACANLAGLSLVRNAARQHEFAVRTALGSGRWRLIRQSLTESFVLAFLGGALGLLLAYWGRFVLSQLLAGTPDGLRYDLTLDLPVLCFTSGLALVTALLSGLLPAFQTGRVNPLAGLKSRTSLGRPRLPVGKILVAAQIALSVLLLAGAGLYGRTLVNLVRIDSGFATENLLLFQLNPSAAGLRGVATTAFYEQVQDALTKVPAVRAVTLTQYKLLSGNASAGGFFTLPAHPEFTGEKRPSAYRLNVSETFFATMDIPLRLGRPFTVADVDGAPKVVVVNDTFARKFFANENPLGQRLKVGNDEWQVVGVCRDAKYADIKAEIPPTVYFSYRQIGAGSVYFAVRTALPPLAIVAAARQAVSTVDPKVPLADITTQAAVRDGSIAEERMFALLVGALAGLAVLLACIGLYGLLSYNVARRTSEFGLRLALGAQGGDIVRPILREALLLAGAGLAVGVPTALALAQLIKSQLYRVAPTDPLSLTASAGLLLAVTFLASWLPARRAAKVDPMIALRCE